MNVTSISRSATQFLWLTLIVAFVLPTSTAAQTFQDNTFTSGWATSVYSQTPLSPPATAVATLIPIGSGNNARGLFHNFSVGMAMYAVHLSSHTYSPSGGSLTNVQFQYVISAGVSVVGYAPLVAQGGNFYSRPWDLAPIGAMLPINRTLTANDFWLVRSNGTLDETQHPDFSCGAPEIRFGYYTGNSNPPPYQPTVIQIGSSLRTWRLNLSTERCAPQADPCCPPLTTTSVKDQLRLVQPGTVGTNYNFQYVATAPYPGQMQAYINYLHQMNLAINTIAVTWTVTQQGTGATPTVPPGPVVATAMMRWTCSAPGCPAPLPNIQFAGLPLVPNTWYRVTATPSLNNGLRFWDTDCPAVVFEYNMREIP